jgi:hypothetical protein
VILLVLAESKKMTTIVVIGGLFSLAVHADFLRLLATNSHHNRNRQPYEEELDTTRVTADGRKNQNVACLEMLDTRDGFEQSVNRKRNPGKKGKHFIS